MTDQKILAGFYISLLQDINTLRSLIYICHDDLRLMPTLIISKLFYKRDRGGEWFGEISKMSNELLLNVKNEDGEFDMWSYLNGFEGGFVISGSESNLEAHKEAHQLFTFAPSHITTITVQHGFECVGFLMNKTHQHRHGCLVTFAADIVCGWVPKYLQRNLVPSQHSKYIYTGPSAWIRKTSKRDLYDPKDIVSDTGAIGIVCENLHSVRFRSTANVHGFIDQFLELASFFADRGKNIALRPHPGGQYSIKSKVSLPDNVYLETRPSYKISWSEYSFGISAPSSVLFDLLINQVPTAMWQDQFYQVDTDQLPFLPVVRSSREMKSFACNPYKPMIYNQDQRLDFIIDDRSQVAGRFLDIFRNACQSSRGAQTIDSPNSRPKDSHPSVRVMILAPSKSLPTLNISLIRPLMVSSDIKYMLIDGLYDDHGSDRKSHVQDRVTSLIDSFMPDIVLLCREYRKDAQILLNTCKQQGVKSMYYIDDLLYSPSPEVLEQSKYDHWLKRSRTVNALLRSSDAIYCSTQYLGKEISDKFSESKVVYGDIVESVDISKVYFTHSRRKVIGYTGFGHTQDLALVEDILLDVLQSNKDWSLELIGTMTPSKRLLDLGSQIELIPPERSFESFLKLLRSREWSIGICPLVDSRFNHFKSNVKWVEYSQNNIATVASGGPVYAECCSDNCGIICHTSRDWLQALEELMKRPDKINDLVKNAQSKLLNRYSLQRHAQQLNRVFAEVLA